MASDGRQGAGRGCDTDPVLCPELPVPFYHDPIKHEPGEPPFVRQQAATRVKPRAKTHSKTESSSSNQLRLEGKSHWHHGTAPVMPTFHGEPEKQPKVNRPHAESKIATNTLLRWPCMSPSKYPGDGPDTESQVKVNFTSEGSPPPPKTTPRLCLQEAHLLNTEPQDRVS